MMRRLAGLTVMGLAVPCFVLSAGAQGTKLWTTDRYDAMEKGSSQSVAIRSDGALEAGPATSQLFATGGSYVWAMASDTDGNAFVGLGGSTEGSAAVVKISPDGKNAKMFDGKELGVQALRVLADGTIIVATSPNGKVYRVPERGGLPVVVFDAAKTEEKPKYLWDVVLGKNGEMYVAAGAPAAVYRVTADGSKSEVMFKTADQHIRCLMFAADGTLWAGSDGAGVIYKISTTQKDAKPFAAYSASKREITALAVDTAGNIYAAGVGAKGANGLPPLPVTGNVGVTITFSQPGSASAAGANTLVPEGSDIYKIATDGAPEKLLTLKDDVVYALAVHNGELLAATGNRGRVYRVDTHESGRFSDIAHLEAAQAMAFAPVKNGLLVATSNSGKVFRLDDAVAKDATYTSDVFDAQGYSQWGRVETRAAAQGFDLFVRSGNVASPLMGWSDWANVSNDGAVTVPSGRFAQWKAVLRAGGSVDSVGLNYLMKNIAPVVDDIAVQPGARIAPTNGANPNTTVQIAFPATAPVLTFSSDANAGPLTAQKDKTAVTVRWLAHDDNGDDLIYALWYRGVGEANWRLLKDKITDKFCSFDSALLPDGSYEVKVSASDVAAHTTADALSNERISSVFTVDTTPPVPGTLTAALETGKIHVQFEARDATSPIAHAEYSVDAGPWQYVEPTGKVSDSLAERYDFVAAVPPATIPVTDAKEHVVAVRVYDRFENVVTVKTVVR
jgi:sugar lactone lactonase YvrE